MTDSLFKFMLGDGNVRGVVVRLGDAWQEMLRRRRHGSAVQELLGEMSAASALLAGSLKFDGTLILQIHGDGPLRLAVAECQPDFGLRATAKELEAQPAEPDTQEGAEADAAADSDAEADAGTGGLVGLANRHGSGRCVITLDPRQPGQQPYQGIVGLADAEGHALRDLSAVLRQYLDQSEQIPSWLMLAADEHAACGLLVQRMPGAGGKGGSDAARADEDFSRAVHLASTLQRAELLELDPQELLRRLFWEEGARVFEPLRPRFHCTCSKQRVAQMLRMLGREEVESVLAERGEVDVTCEFCGAGYAFDLVDAAQLFHAGVDQPPASSQAQ
ncbi:Hsp33 family molecular chaperone HslO [Thiomonas sp. FB-6]|uniref:Hsp33 family molecular chaperone HslO n=1 Tax=Thiomonas sp. FB-6 TaxID=1158291 RepID=UPI00035FCD14|nr:Hsp33 family molecular chaperone HslO [Thiomonas sp. FB-6]